jgi:hypothetical protein
MGSDDDVADDVLIDALRDHAETLERSTSAANVGHDRDIAQAEKARALAFKIENGEATADERLALPT